MTDLPHTIFPFFSTAKSLSSSSDEFPECKTIGTRRKFGAPSMRLRNKSGNNLKTLKSAIYSGSVIFCRLEKKSDFMMVDADRMLPDRFTTTLVTSSGSATPVLSSARSSGLRALIPSPISSFSKVLITKII